MCGADAMTYLESVASLSVRDSQHAATIAQSTDILGTSRRYEARVDIREVALSGLGALASQRSQRCWRCRLKQHPVIARTDDRKTSIHAQTACTVVGMSQSRRAMAPHEKFQRAVRIGKGLASPTSRGRYVQAARDRFRREVRRCLVCRTPDPEHRTIRSAKNSAAIREVWICGTCGHVSLPDNRNDYRERDYSQLPSSDRTGSMGKPGRDYHIARLALEALASDDVDVLMYGVGASRDNHNISGLPQVSNVAIGDIMKLRDDGEFVDLTQKPKRRFDLVIASEVVEHFRDPLPDFRTLFGFVKRRGLVVCSTSIYAGNDLSRDPYIFFSDHTSYYSADALGRIAAMNGFHIDFRMPVVGPGLRKRYVLLTRSRATLDRMAVYFGTHSYAPSESAYRLRAHKA